MFEIGTSLREARARRKLSYDQVEAETKIRAKYIRSLEDEEFDVLPSGTYVKGFLRTYADYLGLDGQLYVDEYNSRYGDLHVEDQLFRRRDRPPPRRRRESSNTTLVALAVIVCLTAIFFVAWRFGGTKTNGLPAVTVATQPERGASNLAISARTARRAPTAAQQKWRQPVKLAFKTEGGDAWLQIRQGFKGGGGRTFFAGTITPGRWYGPVKFPGGFTIIRAGRAERVTVKVNGKLYALPQGKAPWFVTRKGVSTLPVPSAARTAAATLARGHR